MRSPGMRLPGNGRPVSGSRTTNGLPEKSPPRIAAVGTTACDAAAERLQLAAFVVAEEERPVGDDRPAEAEAVAIVVRVGVGIVARHAVQRLRVGPRVQLVRVVVVERRAVEAVGAALGRDDHAGQAAILRAVRVRQHLHFLDRVEARARHSTARRRSRRSTAGRPGCTRRRRCGRPGTGCESKPPTTFGLSVRKSWMSRLLRGRSRSCCSSRPRAIAWLSSVMLFCPSAVTVTTSSSPPTSRCRSDSDDSRRRAARRRCAALS